MARRDGAGTALATTAADATLNHAGRPRHQRPTREAKNSSTIAERNMLNRFVARNTSRPVKNAMMFVTPPIEAKASTHPAGSASPGIRCRRRSARSAAKVSQPKPTTPTSPRYGEKASPPRHSDQRS